MSVRTNFVYLEGQLFRYEERNAAGKIVSVFTLRLPTGTAKKTDSAFIPVEAWNLNDDLRKLLNENTGKARIAIQGEFRQDNWQDKATGAKRSKLKITAKRVSYEGSWRDETNESSASSGAASSGSVASGALAPEAGTVTEEVPF